MIEFAEILVILVVFVLVGYIPQRKGAKAMKLTNVQVRALLKAEDGGIIKFVRVSTSGARADVIEGLVQNGLIEEPLVVLPKDVLHYTLTPAGRAALDEIRQKEGVAHE